MTEALAVQRATQPFSLKAYVVLEEGDGTGGIVFAKSNAQARREGSERYADGDFDSVSCRRAGEFDHYYPGPVPTSVLFEHGWWFQCGGCRKRLDADVAYDEKLSPIFDEKRGFAWCSPWHKLDDVERDGKYEALKSLGAVMARLALPDDCTILDGMVISQRHGKVGAKFNFPGGMWLATWDNVDGVQVAHADQNAWAQFVQDGGQSCR